MLKNKKGFSYLDRAGAETLAVSIANYLENRDFTKNPHIGLIGPGTKIAESEPMDLLSEIVEEQTEQWVSPYVSGFRVTLNRIAEKGNKINVCYSFSFRIAPPTVRQQDGATVTVLDKDQFRSCDLCFIVSDESSSEFSLAVYDGSRQQLLYSQNATLPIQNGSVGITIPSAQYGNAREFLTTTHELGYGTPECKDKRFIYEFSIAATLEKLSENKLELSVRLTGGDGNYLLPQGTIQQVNSQNSKCRKHGLIDASRSAWSVAQLLEVQSNLRVTGYDFSPVFPSEYGLIGLRAINCAYSLETLEEGEIRFRDYVIVAERGRAIMQSNDPVEVFLNRIISKIAENFHLNSDKKNILSKALSDSLVSIIGSSGRLYTFQEECAVSVLEALLENASPSIAVPLSVQTAGGKTLGFLIPAAIYSFALKQVSESQNGVKSMLFYPTKALINDQSDTILRLLWGLNYNLSQSGYSGPLVSFGMLHGDIPDEKTISNRLYSTTEYSDQIRLKCPLCGELLQVTYHKVGTSGVTEDIKCIQEDCVLSSDNEKISLFNKMVRIRRRSIFADPPDILVATPDMINFRLFFDPSEQSIFGRSVKRCNVCKYTTANLNERRACERCGSELEGPVHFTSPGMYVFDEAHQLRGSFGSQVSYVMSRLEQVVHKITKKENYRSVYVFSSATLSRPKNFIKDFFGKDIPTKPLVSAKYLPDAELVNRIHLFLVPKGYSPEATLVHCVRSTFESFPIKERYPNILIFVNSLSEANEVIHLLRHFSSYFSAGKEHLGIPVVDGHSTDYGMDQRTTVEDGFTRGTINVLVATSTLQVGVDFDRIDALIVYGAPFTLSDYIQRVGRAGRGHAAVIINILPSKPIDFFFFGNYPLITNPEIRDRAINAETVRLSRENETIRRKSAVRALLDYLCTHPDAPRYYKDDPSNRGPQLLLNAIYRTVVGEQTLKDVLQQVVTTENVNPDLIQYVENAMKSTITKSEKKRVLEAADGIIQDLVSRGMTNLSSLMGNRDFLSRISAGDLRNSDYVVKIDHPDLIPLTKILGEKEDNSSRERSLSIALSYYSPGQVTSYRSLFFVVDSVESEPAMSNRIREAIYRNSFGRSDDE